MDICWAEIEVDEKAEDFDETEVPEDEEPAALTEMIRNRPIKEKLKQAWMTST